MYFPNKNIAEPSDMEDRTLTTDICGVKMGIAVILIRVNLIVYPSHHVFLSFVLH